jgi:hypothetical protein
MSYDRLGPRIQQLEAEVAAILAEAEATDLAEDLAYGEDNRGDEVLPELARRETRLVKLRAAKAAIEAEAQDKAAAKAERKAHDNQDDDAETARAVDLARECAVPEKRARRNFTDPESRMMKTNDGFNYAYNAQAVVDETSQVIIGTRVGTNAGDVDQLLSMIDLTKETLRAAGIDDNPALLLADAGYCSEDNLKQAGATDVDVLIATGRIRRNERVAPVPRGPIPHDATQRERMARRLRTKAGAADYARRKAIVEPVFGQMKVRQHAGFLRLRGLEGAQADWTLHAVCHNLRKLANSRTIGVIRTA